MNSLAHYRGLVISLAHYRLTVATRNCTDFEKAGVEVVDPFDGSRGPG